MLEQTNILIDNNNDKLYPIVCNIQLLRSIIKKGYSAINEIFEMKGENRPKLFKIALMACEHYLYKQNFEKASQMYLIFFNNVSKLENIFTIKDCWSAYKAFIQSDNLMYKSCIIKIIEHMYSNNIESFELFKNSISLTRQTKSNELLQVIIRIIKQVYNIEECPLNIIFLSMIYNNKKFIIAANSNLFLPPLCDILFKIESLPVSTRSDWTDFINNIYF